MSYELAPADPISGDMVAAGLRAKVQMLESLICRIAKQMPPGALCAADACTVDAVVNERMNHQQGTNT